MRLEGWEGERGKDGSGKDYSTCKSPAVGVLGIARRSGGEDGDVGRSLLVIPCMGVPCISAEPESRA